MLKNMLEVILKPPTMENFCLWIFYYFCSLWTNRDLDHDHAARRAINLIELPQWPTSATDSPSFLFDPLLTRFPLCHTVRYRNWPIPLHISNPIPNPNPNSDSDSKPNPRPF